MARIFSVILTIALSILIAGPTAAQQEGWTTAKGLFRVSYTPSAEPIPLNRIHAWTFHVTTADGAPVEDALLEVDGGMPAHDHGLPTSPRQSGALGGGDYRVEGMRFHMMGDWEIKVRVSAGGTDDSVTIPLRL